MSNRTNETSRESTGINIEDNITSANSSEKQTRDYKEILKKKNMQGLREYELKKEDIAILDRSQHPYPPSSTDGCLSI